MQTQIKEQAKAQSQPPPSAKQRTKQAASLDITRLIPIREVREGIISTPHHRAILVAVEGIDYNIIEPREQCFLVESIAHGIHDQQEYPFMWWYRSQRRSFDDLTHRLDLRRQHERNLLLRNQFLLEQRYLNALARTSSIVSRRSLIVLTQPHAEQLSRSQRSLQLLGRKAAADDIAALSRGKLWQRAAWAAALMQSLQTGAHILGQDEVMAVLAGELGGDAQASDWSGSGASVQIESDYLLLGEQGYRTVLYASSRPRQTNPADLAALVSVRDFDLTVAAHFQPVDNSTALKQIQTNQTYLRARFNSNNNGNPDMRAVNNWHSATQGEAMLADGRAKFYMSSLYVSVHGNSLAELDHHTKQVEELMRLIRLEPQVLRWGQDLGLIATLPLGENPAATRRAMPNLAGAVSRELVSQNTACWVTNLVSTYEHADGIMLGTNATSGSIVMFNPWQVDEAAHTLMLAITGAGKTTTALTEALRWLMVDPNIVYYYIDPQGGTERFTNKIGGTYVRMGAGAVINPLDRREGSGDLTPLDEMIDYLSGLFALMTGLPSRAYEAGLASACEVLYDHFERKLPTHRQVAEAATHALGLYLTDKPGVLDQSYVEAVSRVVSRPWAGGEAVKAALRVVAGERADEYRIATAAGYIYTEHRPVVGQSAEERSVPILGDLIPYLLAAGCLPLAHSLGPFVSQRAYGKHYNGYTNVRLDNRFISFSLFEVAEAHRPIAMYMVMKFVWGEIVREVKRRVCITDEIGLMMTDDPAVAKWVAKMYRRARYFKLRMIAIDQHIGTFLNNEMGRVILDQSSIYYLMRQARSGANERDLANQFHLTQGQVLSRMAARNGNILIVEGGSSKVTEVQCSLSDEQLNSLSTRATLGVNLSHNREVASTVTATAPPENGSVAS